MRIQPSGSVGSRVVAGMGASGSTAVGEKEDMQYRIRWRSGGVVHTLAARTSTPGDPPMIRTTRHIALPVLALAAVACAGEGDAPASGDATTDEAALVERARGIHERVITIDTHVDIRASNFTPETNYTRNIPGTQVDLP